MARRRHISADVLRRARDPATVVVGRSASEDHMQDIARSQQLSPILTACKYSPTPCADARIPYELSLACVQGRVEAQYNAV